MFDKYEKVIKVIANISLFLACIATAGMTVVGFVDVMLRLIFRRPIVGATEFVLVMFLCLPAAMAKVALNDDFTKVPIVVEKFPRSLRRVVNLITVGITCVFSFVVSWRFVMAGIYSKDIGITYSLAKIPEWPFQFVMAFSFFALGLALPVVMRREWKGDAKEKTEP